MTWDTSDIVENDIILQDGVFAYNFIASGTIYKGQAVCICGDNKVMVCNDGSSDASEADVVGLATYNATNGNQISVAGPGNICNCCTNGQVSVSTAVYGTDDGCLHGTQGNATKVAGYMVTTSTLQSTHYKGLILLI